MQKDGVTIFLKCYWAAGGINSHTNFETLTMVLLSMIRYLQMLYTALFHDCTILHTLKTLNNIYQGGFSNTNKVLNFASSMRIFKSLSDAKLMKSCVLRLNVFLYIQTSPLLYLWGSLNYFRYKTLRPIKKAKIKQFHTFVVGNCSLRKYYASRTQTDINAKGD